MSGRKKPAPRSKRKTVADSIGQAAALVGLPVSEVKRARDAGCPAFNNSRVDVEVLKEWLSNMPPPPDDPEGSPLESKELLERRRLRAQWLLFEHKLEVEKRAVISIDEHNRAMTKAAHAARTVIMELKPTAPTWSGLTPAEIDTQVDAFIDRVCTALSDAGSAVYS